MGITKEQLELWMQHPVTQIYFNAVDKERNRWMDLVANGWTLHEDSADRTAQQTAKRIGFIMGLDFATTFLAEEATEEEDEPIT